MSDFQKTEQYQKMKDHIENLQMENEKLQYENRMWKQKCQAIEEDFQKEYQGVREKFYDLEQTIDKLIKENQNCIKIIEDLRAERYSLLEYRDRIETVRKIVNCN